MWKNVCIATLLSALATSGAQADDPPLPSPAVVGRIGNPAHMEQPVGRIGNPAHMVLPPRWALPSDTGHSIGYHVGGGNPFWRRAEPRHPDEGTWGWDYQGWLLPRRVLSGWWHGRRYQGGTGAYRTDGPKLYYER